MTDVLLMRREDRVAVLTLSRPERPNALDTGGRAASLGPFLNRESLNMMLARQALIDARKAAVK